MQMRVLLEVFSSVRIATMTPKRETSGVLAPRDLCFGAWQASLPWLEGHAMRLTRAISVQAVMDMIASREVLPPPPRKLFDLDEAPAAVTEAQKTSAGGLGKVMLISYLV